MSHDLNNQKTLAWVKSWYYRHNDARHPGTRRNCETCREMIRDFGRMPPPDLIWAYGRMLPKDPRAKAIISPALRRSVFDRDGHTCLACGATSDLSVDHIHPEVRGGLTTFDNLQTLCRSCNSKKGAR